MNARGRKSFSGLFPPAPVSLVYRKNWKPWIFQKLLKACDLKVGRCRTINWANEDMEGSKVISWINLFSRTGRLISMKARPRYQVSIYRTNGPLVFCEIFVVGFLLLPLCLDKNDISTEMYNEQLCYKFFIRRGISSVYTVKKFSFTGNGVMHNCSIGYLEWHKHFEQFLLFDSLKTSFRG